MLNLSHPITSINGFKIGDRVRLKDGDGRPHIIKSFSVDGMKEFFFEVQFEDGTDAMLDNIALLPSNLDEAAEEFAYTNWESDDYHEGASEGLPFDAIGHTAKCFKAGAEWMAGQGVTVDGIFKAGDPGYPDVRMGEQYSIEHILHKPDGIEPGDKVVVQIRKKQPQGYAIGSSKYIQRIHKLI